MVAQKQRVRESHYDDRDCVVAAVCVLDRGNAGKGAAESVDLLDHAQAERRGVVPKLPSQED